MAFDRERHHRRSLRLRGYDYGQSGFYFVTVCFVTVCTWGREPILGEVANGEACPNGIGTFVWRTWEGLLDRFHGVEVDAFVVMPNHVHGIVVLGADSGADPGGAGEGRASPAPTSVADAVSGHGKVALGVGAGLALPASPTPSLSPPSLGAIIGAFKSVSAIGGNRLLDRGGRPFWQRNYYEHVIRSDSALERIRRYIAENPANWETDAENPRVARQ